MCGIAGWINLDDDLTKQKDIITAMTKVLSRRGPDAEGYWTSPNALLGHRRLVVVDPKGGGQPMVRILGNNTYVIVYNGELYNTLDLRKKLEAKGHFFTSNSDTEVLLVSYIEWGPHCIEHLNGIFAFGIWNENDRSLFLGRDRFGVKPLFYTQKESSFIFGSELKVLLANPQVKAEVASDGLAEIFALGPSRTPGHGIYKGVYEVLPAQCILFDPNGIKVRKYWSLESKPHVDNISETIEKIRSLVLDAINRQLVADVPVCTFLSGGLDSSAISAVASKAMSHLHTFSIDYVDNEKYFTPSSFQPNSDAPWVTRVSQEFGTNHHYIFVDTPEIVSALEDAVEARDLPGMTDVDSSLLLFCKEIKKCSTVALSGECADEIFGGYPWFHREDMLNANTFPWSKNLDERKKVLSKNLINFIKPDEYVASRYENTLSEVPRLIGESPLEARRREMFYLNMTWFMCTLLDRKDRMSMYSGLEVRVPYCDHRIVEYLWNVPWEMKMLDGREKGLLRKALEGVLPDDILWRKKSPYPKTHNPAYEKAVKNKVLEIINDNSSPLLPLIDFDAVYRLAESDSDYGKPWFGQLMATPQLFAYLYQVDTWMRKYNVRIV